jgi:hypothetical protein
MRHKTAYDLVGEPFLLDTSEERQSQAPRAKKENLARQIDRMLEQQLSKHQRVSALSVAPPRPREP